MEDEKPAVKVLSVQLAAVVVLQCVCGHVPVILEGFGSIAACPKCRRRYAVAKVDHQWVEADGGAQAETGVHVGELPSIHIQRKTVKRDFALITKGD